MHVTFLGTGTSHGIPMIGCDCAVCHSDDPRNRRYRPSILVTEGDLQILVDPTPDFRSQALAVGLKRLDAVLITHAHADHVLGLDDLRVFCASGRKLPVYGSAPALAALRQMFSYACTERPAWPGLPSLSLQTVNVEEGFNIQSMPIRVCTLPHGRMDVLGLVFRERFAYLTDCNAVADEIIASLDGIPVLAIDALRYRPHPTHLTIEQALSIIARVRPQQAWLTHLCHEVDHATAEAQLPAGVRLAYDGLGLTIPTVPATEMTHG